jgi:hypothetical protein
MKKYLLEVDEELWQAFKIVASMEGLYIKDAMPQALMEFVEAHKAEQVQVNIHVVEGPAKDLLSIIYEEDIKTFCLNLLEAKRRNSPRPFTDNLKRELLKSVKAHPKLSKELAQDVVETLRQLQK